MFGLVGERIEDSKIGAHPLNRECNGCTSVMNQAAHSALLSVPAFVHQRTTAKNSFCISSRSFVLGNERSWVVLPRFQVETSAERMQRKDAKKDVSKKWQCTIRDSLVDVSAPPYNTTLISRVDKIERS